jgi:tripartite ATP-independent transporter DctP family solute receptor
MKNIIKVAFMFSAIFCLAFSFNVWAEEFVCKYATVAAEATPSVGMLKVFKEDLEKKTNGKIKVEIYHSGVLGGDREQLESLQRNAIQGTGVSTAPLVSFQPKMAVWDLPFLFPTMKTPAETLEVMNKILDSKPALDLLRSLEDVGMVGLGYFAYGHRNLTSNRPVKKLEDLNGFKIRTMNAKYHLALWKALGANATPISFTELYSALEQGTIDGEENPYITIHLQKFYEVQKYVTNTNHILGPIAWMFSKKWYDSLPADLKPIVNESSMLSIKWFRDYVKRETLNTIKALKDKGMTFIDLEPEEMQRWIEASKPARKEVIKQVGPEIAESILTSVKEIKKGY